MDATPAGTRGAADEAVRAACDRGEIDLAATLALRQLGPEVYGFLVGTQGSDADADDAFSELCVAVWRGLPGFDWRCSLRTWMYVLARHAGHRTRRQARRHAARRAHLPSSLASRLAAEIRTRTASFLGSRTKSAFQALRDELDEDDRALLGLRVDRAMEWTDIARIFADEEPSDPESLKRTSARLRKRFQVVKERLRKLGVERGLIDEGSS